MPSIIVPGLTNGEQYTARQVTFNGKGYPNSKLQGALSTATPVDHFSASQLLGCVLKLPESGEMVDFLALKSNYQNSGGTLLLRKETFTSIKMAWSSKQTYANAYVGSNVDTWLTNTYLQSLSEIQDFLLEPSIPVILGAGNYTTVQSVSRKAFLLSASEYNLKALSNFGDLPSINDGEPISYFDSLDKTYEWTSNTSGLSFALSGTRTPATTPGGNYPGRYAICLYATSGSIAQVTICSVTSYDRGAGFSPRPAICLSNNLPFSPIPNADGSYSPI